MYDIDMPEISREFLEWFAAAGRHIESLAPDMPAFCWQKASPTPPFLEHL